MTPSLLYILVSFITKTVNLSPYAGVPGTRGPLGIKGTKGDPGMIGPKGEQGQIERKLKSRKSARWSAEPVPCPRRLCLKLKGKQGSGPEGVDDLCFHTYGEFSPSPPSAPPPALRPKF